PSGRLGPLAVRRVAPWTAPAPRPPTGSEGRRGPGGLARALRRGGRAGGGVGPPGRRALTPPEDCPKMAALPPETPKPRSQEGTDPMAQDPKERSRARSEERRVGKEGRDRGGGDACKEKQG